MQLNIDTAAARTAHVNNINQKASEFVAQLEDRLDDLTSIEQDDLLERLMVLMASKSAAEAFAAGTYAQDSSGQPARALGSSSSTPDSPSDNEWNFVKALREASQGEISVIAQILHRDANQRLEIDPRSGEIAAVKAAETERDKAKDALRDERNENHNGSLAQQLAQAQATPATPADMVRKDAVLPLAEAAKGLVDSVKPAATGGAKAKKTEALAKVDEVIALVS